MEKSKINFEETKVIEGHEITYREYLEEYWSDQTTTPKGVAPRMFVSEVDVYLIDDEIFFDLKDAQQHQEENHIKEAIQEDWRWAIFSWGKPPSIFNKHIVERKGQKVYLTEEEAEMTLLEMWDEQHRIQSGGVNDPLWE